MSEPLVHLERHDDGVAVLTLANGKMNALSTAVLGELTAAARSLADDPPGAVVLTGGPRIFAAGAEISEFGGPDEARTIGAAFTEAAAALEAIERITIASISGYALGGGCELALACDLRIASSRAKLGQPEVLLGIIPGGGGTQRLTRLIGASRAKDLICSGRQVGAEEALAMGLVNEVVDAETLDEHVRERAAAFAAGAVLAQAAAKRAIDGGMDGGLDGELAAGLALEQDEFAAIFATQDAATGVRSFLEQGPGKAVFEGR